MWQIDAGMMVNGYAYTTFDAAVQLAAATADPVFRGEFCLIRSS